MIRIITDSSTLYTAEEAKALGFDAIPLCVTIADLEGRDLTVDMDVFYGKISEGHNPMSSQPPIGEVVDKYEEYSEDEIINISMADGLSGTYQSACSAKEMVDNNDNITVINSKTLCGPHRYLVEQAQKMKDAGHTKQEIVDWVNDRIEKTESFLIPQDFGFLRRGGRLTPMAATLGSVLKLKPVMTLTEDGKRLDKFAVKRTMSAAVKTVIEHLKEKELGEKHILYVSHARAEKDALHVKELMEKEFEGLEVQILKLGAAFVTQGGPQCVAIQYIER